MAQFNKKLINHEQWLERYGPLSSFTEATLRSLVLNVQINALTHAKTLTGVDMESLAEDLSAEVGKVK